MANPFQRHCSDETLISHLDGELAFYAKGPVRRHLERCWSCRLRLSEIETQVLATTRALNEDVFPGPERIAAARLRFLNQADRIADEILARRRVWRQLPALAWAAAAVLLIGVASVLTFDRRDVRADAEAAMERVAAAEAKVSAAPVHQRFRVTARQTQPVGATRTGRLDVWSQPDRGRYATSFEDADGVVRHAVWQPDSARQYVYRPAAARQVVRISRERPNEKWDLLREGVSLEDLEAGLLTWIENRAWRPVSISAAMASLASSDGASLTMEQVADGGASAVRLTAGKSSAGVAVEFVLDVDARTYTPRLQTIRYTSGGRSLELLLRAEDAPQTMPASFEPPSFSAEPAAPAVRRSDAAAIPQGSAELEIGVHRALHDRKACLGETVEVAANSGAIEVRGVVATPERKAELVAALSALGDPRLAIDIRSAQDVLHEMSPASVADSAGTAAPVKGRSGVEWLARVLGVREPEAEEFADRAISAGEALMRDAQALRQLRERFEGRPEFDAPTFRESLRHMELDHIAALARQAEALRALIAPLLPGARVEPATAGIFDLAKTVNDRLRAVVLGESQDRQSLDAALAQLQAALRGR